MRPDTARFLLLDSTGEAYVASYDDPNTFRVWTGQGWSRLNLPPEVYLEMAKYSPIPSTIVAKIGDIVEVMQTRPLSKLKRWRLLRVVQRAAQS